MKTREEESKYREDFINEFKQRFNKLRDDMTQAQFAEFLGISRPTVGFYENGDRIPDAVTLKKIVSKCGVTADYLLGETDTPNREYVNIADETGLTDDAITHLIGLLRLSDELYFKCCQHVINTLLENWFLLLDFNRGILDYAINVKQIRKEKERVAACTLKPESLSIDDDDKSVLRDALRNLELEKLDEKAEYEEWILSKKILAVARSIAEKLMEEDDELLNVLANKRSKEGIAYAARSKD